MTQVARRSAQMSNIFVIKSISYGVAILAIAQIIAPVVCRAIV